MLHSPLSCFLVFRLTCMGYSFPIFATFLAPFFLELAFIWCSAGLRNLLCGGGNWEKFGLHVGNMKFNEQNNMCVILPVYFYVHHIQLNIPATDDNRNTLTKMQLTRPGCCYFWHNFSKCLHTSTANRISKLLRLCQWKIKMIHGENFACELKRSMGKILPLNYRLNGPSVEYELWSFSCHHLLNITVFQHVKLILIAWHPRRLSLLNSQCYFS